MKQIETCMLKIAASVFVLQTLNLKFSVASKSVNILSKLGLQPYGRIGIGLEE